MTIRQDITINQGETWSRVYTHTDATGAAVDLTGYSARMAIKSAYGGSAYAYLSTDSDASGGTITLGGAAGTVTLSMTAAQTAGMVQSGAQWSLIYDLELVSGSGAVTRALEGPFIVRGEVTG